LDLICFALASLACRSLESTSRRATYATHSCWSMVMPSRRACGCLGFFGGGASVEQGSTNFFSDINAWIWQLMGSMGEKGQELGVDGDALMSVAAPFT
jgi:hypothetical protein